MKVKDAPERDRAARGARGPARPRMRGVARREQILDVTRALASARGFHAVSIDAVARGAGVSRPIVYGHFEDLPGLLEAMIERESRRALEQLAEVLPRAASGEPRAALLAALRGYLEAVRAEPLTWQLVLVPPEGAPELLREHVRRGRNAIVAALAEFVGPGLDPRFASPDPALTARLLSAAADEAARLLLTAPREYPIERLLEHAAWILARLGPSPGGVPEGG